MSVNGHTEARSLHDRFHHPTRRFPELNLAFREGGVGWEAIENTGPHRLDHAAVLASVERYGTPAVVEAVRRGEGLDDRRANPTGARLHALFSLDIGHFDVPDMTEVVPDAGELVEHGRLTGDDFRDFTFANAVRFRGEVNPDFVKGTVDEKQAAEGLAWTMRAGTEGLARGTRAGG
jgi:hypothetical protein